MDVIIQKGKLHDVNIAVPSSKSVSIRALIAASLAEGDSEIHGLCICRDTEAVMKVLEERGISMRKTEDRLTIRGKADSRLFSGGSIFCGESATALRFLIPLAACGKAETRFSGEGRLLKRPLSVYETLFREQGLLFQRADNFLKVSGKLHPGKIRIRGDISSHFTSGLLFALPLLDRDSELNISTDPVSEPYIELTADVLHKAGIRIVRKETGYYIPGSQHYHPFSLQISGDDSQAAFLIALSQIGRICVSIPNMAHDSLQGDHVIIRLIREMGGIVRKETEGYSFMPGSLKAISADLRNCPDLGPVLFVLASQAEGISEFRHADRLRDKESDRIRCMQEELAKAGCLMEVNSGCVRIHGNPGIPDVVVFDGHGDHRIVMALSLLAFAGPGTVRIRGCEAVRKSYPDFFKDLSSAGAGIRFVNGAND